MAPPLEFDAYLEPTGPNVNWCFLAAPFDVRAVFGTKARVAVRGTINGFAFRSSFSPMGGRHLLCINKAMQHAAGVRPGATAHFFVERDDAPRVVDVPPMIAKTLRRDPETRAIFEKLSFTHKKEYVEWIMSAKKDETRKARLAKLGPMLRGKQRVKGGWILADARLRGTAENRDCFHKSSVLSWRPIKQPIRC